MKMELPEEQAMWKEKKALEETKDETSDPFIPAKLVEPTKDEDLLVRIIL